MRRKAKAEAWLLDEADADARPFGVGQLPIAEPAGTR